MNLFAKAKQWLPAAVQTAAGVTVTYARGVEQVTLTAVVGRTAFASNEQGAARVEFGDRDYLIAVADLVIGGRAVEPADGDTVTDADGQRFEVKRPGTGEPAWRYSDPQRTTYRLHTKRTA